MRWVVRLALAGLVFAGPATALAAPSYVRLSYTGDTATTISVTWNTTANSASEVKLGASPGNYTQSVSGTTIQANTGLGYVHEVTVSGLSPSTAYYYVAGSASDGYSKETSFVTGPTEDANCGGFRFAFLADNRPDPIFGGGENWPQILGQCAQQQPAFILNGGDMVIDGDQIAQWLTLLGYTENAAKSIPFMPTIGNHDTGPGSGDGANYNQLFSLPVSTGANASNTEDYYFFTYGNAIFVSLSTDTFSGGSTAFATQAAWLDTVLAQNPKKWKIVFFHKPIYTTEAPFSISHPPNEANQNAALVPIFDKHHVDIVFTSHNHWYERFEPSNCTALGKPGSATPCSTGANGFATGTVYIVSGGAGAFTIPAFLCGNTAGRAACSGDHHYVVVQIDNEKLKLETWGASPQPNAVFDSISITKPADVCGVLDAGVPDAGELPDASTGGSAGLGVAGQTGSGGSAAVSSGGSATGASGGSAPKDAGSDAAVSGGKSGKSAADSGDDGGCGCRLAGSTSGSMWLMLLAISGLGRRILRRSRRQLHQ